MNTTQKTGYVQASLTDKDADTRSQIRGITRNYARSYTDTLESFTTTRYSTCSSFSETE